MNGGLRLMLDASGYTVLTAPTKSVCLRGATAPSPLRGSAGGRGGAVCLDVPHSAFLCETVLDLPCILDRVGDVPCKGVETVRFWFVVVTGGKLDAGIGRGGLGGGIFSKGAADLSTTVLCGLGGIIGFASPVILGVSWTPMDPWISISFSLLLLAVAGCTGGRSGAAKPICMV